ncbi:hypothetical protein CAPTEDRAFT_226076 [Capitella teleta]|uniref:Coiled-coil domain-containing protein 169 n=1 Tax=Capitella teleta TaxID=283909 RepID=R7UQK9_CAPTE|nr:hypothetical protein CAPTEDRAFT_226076 [Capitella teleta]|eukprot:ELU08814.1 hypothetical protein CAPTEDRAFT_226076 [Capitella teleta]
MTADDEFEIERLRAELAQERQMSEMLESSLKELGITLDEMDKRSHNFDQECNEWKTRYETQVEMNQQLEKQAILLATKVEESKRTLKELKMPKTARKADTDAEVTPHYVKALEKEKIVMENQLRDLEWRLDQESKAYYRATEERKNYVTEISAAKEVIENMKKNQQNLDNTPRSTQAGSNIPQDQRVIDPRRGPIRKTAAIKTLPRI